MEEEANVGADANDEAANDEAAINLPELMVGVDVEGGEPHGEIGNPQDADERDVIGPAPVEEEANVGADNQALDGGAVDLPLDVEGEGGEPPAEIGNPQPHEVAIDLPKQLPVPHDLDFPLAKLPKTARGSAGWSSASSSSSSGSRLLSRLTYEPHHDDPPGQMSGTKRSVGEAFATSVASVLEDGENESNKYTSLGVSLLLLCPNLITPIFF